MAQWWLEELEGDPAYADEVLPLLKRVLPEDSGERVLDIGCGNGHVSAVFGPETVVIGVDLNPDLAALANGVVGRLPALPFVKDGFSGAYCVLTLEHVENEAQLFEEVARVVRPRGFLALVINHPAWTAPGSTPISDTDGETLWRPGDYFGRGSSIYGAGAGEIRFFHRSMGELMTNAANQGWALEEMVERRHPDLNDQTGIPRLLACRWQLLP